MSLIGVLVAVSILGIVTILLATTLKNATNGVALVESRMGRANLVQDLRAEIENPALCRTGLAQEMVTYNGAVGTQMQMRYRFGSGALVAQNSTHAPYSVRVNSFSFLPTLITNLGGGRREVFGDLNIETAALIARPREMAGRPVGRLTLTLNGSNIEDCALEMQNPETACRSLKGEWSANRCNFCVERYENVTWCRNNCLPTVQRDGVEIWTLLNQVGSPTPNSGCVGNLQVTCRFRVTCDT